MIPEEAPAFSLNFCVINLGCTVWRTNPAIAGVGFDHKFKRQISATARCSQIRSQRELRTKEPPALPKCGFCTAHF